ncbi:MAG: methylmalonyl Co-A mutase-associated GTPase MeaB [bacterium]
MNDSELIKRFFTGDRIALSKMISRAENSGTESDSALDEVLKRATGSYRIGITGPPGAGKSTLLDKIVERFRKENETVGVVAVDPTSPFTGGALLGDRIRMNSIDQDPGVFIRSMATRGSLGGLAHTTQEIADVLDAFGKNVIILETVGVGQSEFDVVQAADTVVVVLVPESGDSIQAMKAGLMEIADVFVLNKSDHENAKRAYTELESVLNLNRSHNGWLPSIVQTVAHQGEGVEDLMGYIAKHREYLGTQGGLETKRRERIKDRLKMKIGQKLQAGFWTKSKLTEFDKLVDKILNGTLSYSDALTKILND